MKIFLLPDTVLDTVDCANGEVEAGHNVLAQPVVRLEQAELADFAPGVGDVEVAGPPLAGDVLDGLHDQVRRAGLNVTGPRGLLVQEWRQGSQPLLTSGPI